jgi:prepilin-type N-terminal cleavage/methylation domain-containing protein
MKDKSLPPARRAFTLLELVVVILIIAAIFAFFWPPMHRGAGEAARRTACLNNLKQIGLALHNYHDVYGSFPPAYTVDADGNRLHSWRTLILPYADHAPLYEKIDLSRPWDDPGNAAVMAENPYIEIYACPSAVIPNGHTTYHGVVSADGFFHPHGTRSFADIADKQKLAVVEVDASRAVHWMSPHDVGEEFIRNLRPETKTSHEDGIHVLRVEGSVVFLPSNTPQAERQIMLDVTKTTQPAEEQ